MPDVWVLAIIGVKALLYASALWASGLALMAVVARRDFPSVRRALAVVLLVASIANFALRGTELTGGWTGMVDPEILGLLWQTNVGDALILRLIGGAIVLMAPRIALVGAVVVLWSFAQVGHVQTVDQTGVRVLHFIHLIGLAFWIGVLLPLHQLARDQATLSKAAQLGHWFGRCAMIIVPALICAGAVLAWLLVGDWAALIQTDYGRLLMAKIALVAILLALAAANKLRFVPRMQAGDFGAAQHLVLSIRFEAAVILCVILATATLTSVVQLPQ